jgi:transketolase
MEQFPMQIEDLKKMAARMRADIIDMIHTAQAGHPGGSLSATDIVTALYFRIMKLDPENPAWEDRDRFVLSKGHACPVWYAALCNRSYYDRVHLGTLRKMDSILQGHACMKKTPGVDFTVGSLGQGICAAVGMALGARVQKKNFRVYTVVGDGESQEGSVWEAAMAGAKWKLDNLTVVIDNNGLQNDTFTNDIMPLGDIPAKWRAFGWNVLECNGHVMEEVVDALEKARDFKGKPTCIVAKTVKGKGVSFMENVPKWHGTAPDDEQYALAMKEIKGAK